MADADSRTGTRYATPEIIHWLDELHAGHDAGLERAFLAPGRHGMPAIQVGISEGKLLTLLLRMAGAKKVVEFGTLAGYSAIRMAQALPADGHLWSLEFQPKHADVARANLDAAGLSKKVTVVVGPAMDALPGLAKRGPFDAVFIDADKGSYDLYGAWAAEVLRPGGLLLGDNAYYFGNLLDEREQEAAAMRRFHQQAREAFDTVCIPTPDGLLLGIKK
ncbi:MAG TPA: O-methyltransferase [Holophagaceae bacterium]|jgi:predicted O-methyltransferase YrrM|nr:O-methyltransferase [Holophagaceae bacterium]